MAKKTRIDRRGKIRSLTRKQPPIVRLQWRKGKTLAVLARRRFIDDVWITSEVVFTDSILRNLNRVLDSDSISMSDTAVLNGEKIIIDSPTFTDDGFVKDVDKPGLADAASITDTIGFKLQDNLMLFNNNEINAAPFNAIAYLLQNETDTQTITDSISLAVTTNLSDSAIMSDNVGMSLFVPNQPMNTNIINLATLNG